MAVFLGTTAQNHYAVFVATDRHQETTKLQSVVAQAKNYIENNYGCSISAVVHGGDLVNNSSSGTLTAINAEFLDVLTDLTTSDIYYTWGSHDENVSSTGTNGYLVSSGVVARDMSGAVDLGGQAWLWGIDYNEMTNATTANSGAAVFTSWVNSLADDDVRPIIIMSHVPLHHRRGDNYGATTWLTAINEAAIGRDIIFLWGHNHTGSTSADSNHAYVAGGGSLTPEASTGSGGGGSGPGGGSSGGGSGSAGSPVTINFTYMNAGYITSGTHGWNGSTITIDDNYINIDNFSTSSHYTNRIITRKTPVSTTQYTVTATAEPQEGGTVLGTETPYYANATCILQAAPYTGYGFSHWTQNDSIVGTEPVFSFTVTSDTSFVAHFVPVDTYTVGTMPATNGSLSAWPTVASEGDAIVLTPEPEAGYLLDEWIVFKSDDAATRIAVTNNHFVMPAFDVTVTAGFTTPTEAEVAIGSGTSTSNYLPTDLTKKYSLTEQIYLPSEIGTAGTITALAFYKSSSDQGARSRSLDVYLKHTSKMEFENTSNWENVSTDDRVFSGTVTVPTAAGWITITLDTPFEYNGSDNLLVCFDDNSNTTTSRERSFYVYQVDGYLNRAIISRGDTDYDPTDITTQGTTAISNENNQIKFSITLSNAEAPTQNVVLNQGWTWWAPTVALPFDSLKTVLDTQSSESLLIDAQAKGFVQRNDNVWGGTLDTLLVGQMYKIYSPTALVFTLTGRQSIALVTLTEGYTWFGYAGAQRTDIATALGSFEPADGDEIISLLGVATYSSDSGWQGAFSQLSPGQGYIYHTATTGTQTIQF